MEITIDDLLKGKATKIKDKAFYETEAYVTPFLERMQKITSDFKVKVELPDQITVTKKEDVDFDDITYNRVWVQAVLPQEYDIDNHQDVIGMVYGLDVRKPIVKFYRGGLNRACCNLCVFDPSYLQVQALEPSKAINFRGLDGIIEKSNEIKAFLNKLHNTPFSRDEQNINENLGMWVRNTLDMSYDNTISKAKLATSMAVDAYKLLFKDAKSPYFVNPGSNTDMFNVYNAFTELISNKDKDIMNECEKTLLVRDIIGLNE